MKEVKRGALQLRLGDIIEGPDGNYHEVVRLQRGSLNSSGTPGVAVRSVSGDVFLYRYTARVLVVGHAEYPEALN